jgi:hypothetical protein
MISARAVAKILERITLGIAPLAQARNGVVAHVEDADRFARGFLKRHGMRARGKARARATEIEIGVDPSLREFRSVGFAADVETALDDLKARITKSRRFMPGFADVSTRTILFRNPNSKIVGVWLWKRRNSGNDAS